MEPAKRGGGYYKDDGPGTRPPVNLDRIPDARPKAEPMNRYANRPYTVFGKNYVPANAAGPYKARGIASWYGRRFHGQMTSSGETYDMYAMTAAHPTLPIPSYVRVTRLENNKSVVVRINDRGPFHGNRLIDLSYTAAYRLGYLDEGSARVEVESILPADFSAAETAKAVANLAGTPAANEPPAQPASSIYLQLGAFGTRAKADELMARLRAKLGSLGEALQVFLKDGLYRVHAGPFENRDAARAAAGKIKRSAAIDPILTIR